MSGRDKKNPIGPILFLYYEESLISSNLNSKQLRFHGVRPNIQSKSRGYSKKTVNQLYIYSTVLGAAIKCK